MTSRRLVRLVAAALLAAATGTVLPTGPAEAAACSSDTGVTVVVDFSKVGGGIATTCVADGGGDSAASLLDVDHALTRDQQYPGVVCRIDGAPGDAECATMPPANAYWGLFWSDGHGGWTYSSEGVDNLNVPEGGSVGMAWQDGGTNDPPGAAPPQHSSASPSSSPSSSSGGGSHTGGRRSGSHPGTTPAAPTSSAGGVSASPSGTPASAASSTGAHRARERGSHHRQREHGHHGAKATDPASSSPSPSASPSDDPSAAVPVADPPDASSDHLPWWVVSTLLAGLFATAGVVALQRRRRRT